MLLDHFPAGALSYARERLRDGVFATVDQPGDRFCGRCVALALLEGLEAVTGAPLPCVIACGDLTAASWLNIYLHLQARTEQPKLPAFLDLGPIVEQLHLFIGWVALSPRSEVLWRLGRDLPTVNRHGG